MTKLFSLESDSSDKPELLIDKVIRQADKNKEGMQVTADLLKQRQAVRQEIDQELKKSEDAPEEQEGEEGDPDDAGEVKDSEEGQDKDTGAKDTDESGEEKEQGSDDGEELDATEEAQDEGSLEDLVGSEAGDTKGKKQERIQKDKEDHDTATENYRVNSFYQALLFGGIVPKHTRYVAALEEYNLTANSSAPTKQTVAYVKEEVLESLKKMTVLANRYTAKNTRQVESGHRALLSISENLTVYQATREASKLHLTLKIVSDEEVLKQLGTPTTTNLKATTGLMVRDIEHNTALVIKT